MIRRFDRWALLLGALGFVLALPVLTYPMGRDQGMYANIAQAIRAGGLPFIDMWDIKPPAIYYIYAAGISAFGATPAALRALDLVAAPLTLLALFGITDTLAGRRAARWAMLLFPVFYFTETFASLSQSDSLVTLPMTWAVLCALRASRSRTGSRRAVLWAFGCGLICALVMLFKHYYALFAAALALAHLWTRRREIGRGLALETAAFAAGGLLIGIPVVVYFASTGILAEMLTIAQGTAQYNGEALTSLSAFWAQMENYVWFRWWHWGPLIVLAASGVLLWMTRPKKEKRAPEKANVIAFMPSESAENRPVRAAPSDTPLSRLPFPFAPRPSPLLALWLIAGVVFVVIQAKGFDTHWIPLLPPLVILAARALDGWLKRIERLRAPLGGRKGWLAGAATVGLVVLFGAILAKDTWARAWPYLTGEQTQRAYWRQFQAGDLNAAESLRMATWLQSRTGEEDSVYIWGFRPEIAFLAGLHPATRFQAQFPLVGDRYPQAWKQENVDTLWAAMPPYVVVMRGDIMPWVTGTEKDSNLILAEDYQPLRDWLIANYDRETEIGNFLIWRRKT